MFSLGKRLRNTYKSFLEQAVIKVQAPDTPRTKLSTQLCVKGLSCTNVSYTYTDEQQDPLMGPIYKTCPTYIALYKKYIEGSGIVPSSVINALKFFSEQTGLEITTVGEAADILDILFSQMNLGMEPPVWCNTTVLKLMKDVNNFAFRSFSATPELKQYVGGPLLKKILEDSKENTNTMYLYSPHGKTISALMASMNISIDRPPYSSNIIIEIGSIFNNRHIKVLYQDFSEKQPKVMDIPNCTNPCYLNKFYNLMENNMPKG